VPAFSVSIPTASRVEATEVLYLMLIYFVLDSDLSSNNWRCSSFARRAALENTSFFSLAEEFTKKSENLLEGVLFFCVVNKLNIALEFFF
jgi:hypothetical protein